MKSIAIIFLGDFYHDARCINMADTFIDEGMDVQIFHVAHQNSQYRNSQLTAIDLSSHSKGFRKYLLFLDKVIKLLRAHKFDLVIASDLYSLPATCMYGNAKIIYDSREIYSHIGGLSRKPIKQKIWQWTEKLYINKASTVLITAKSDGEVLKKSYPQINTLLIQNFPSKKLKPTFNNKLRNMFNIPDSSPVFLYQGMLFNGRGIKIMIEMLLPFTEAHVVLIGEGNIKEKLKAFAQKLGVEERVHFTGRVPYQQLLEYTASATIGFSLIEPISLSYKHALPNKIFEYALSGIPTLSTDLHEMKAVVEKYNLGVATSLNRDEIKQGIEKILNSNYKYLTSTAEQELVWESQCARLMACIND